MPKPIKLKIVLRVLQEKGFFFVSQKGSHAKFKKEGKVVIVKTTKKEISYGTFRSIVLMSGLQESDFEKK